MATDKSALNFEQRNASIQSLREEQFDVLVIGGGITGCGIALDAASRGLRVGLIEAQDLASGTSSRSSKLIHGGLRYLEQYDFRLVREALHERELMVTTQAPHLVKPVPFLYPLTKKVRERTYVGAGLALYDALRGFNRALPNHKHMSKKTIHEIAPSLNLDIVTGGIQYFDAQVDDARHTMMVARTAAYHGAHIVTNTKCEELLKAGERVIGALVRDQLTGEQFEVKAKVTVMAAGVWSDPLHKKLGITPGFHVRMSKGVHIVLPKSAINSNSGIILKTPVSVLFIIPWGEEWIIGTTDTEYEGDQIEPLADKSDIDYILAQVNKVLVPKILESDILGVFAGLRPLVSRSETSATAELSREHIVDHPASGFVSIAGGKYTTYRIMAMDAINLAAAEISENVPSSCTKEIPILGAFGFPALLNRSQQIADDMELSNETVLHLLNRYGSEIAVIAELLKVDPSLKEIVTPELPYIRAEFLYAVTHEGALSISDVMCRRTRISFEKRDRGLSVVHSIAEIIGPYLLWTLEDQQSSIKGYAELISREIASSSS